MLKLVKNLFKSVNVDQSESINSKYNQLLKNREDRYQVDQNLYFFKVWYGTNELKVQNISASGLAVESEQFQLGQKLTLQIEIDDLVFNEECEVVRIQNGLTALRLTSHSDRYTVLFHRFFAIEKRAHDLSLINDKLFKEGIDAKNAFWCRNASGDEFFVELKDEQINQLQIRVQHYGLQKNPGGQVQIGKFEKQDENRAYGQWVLTQQSSDKKQTLINLIRFVDHIDLLDHELKKRIHQYLNQLLGV